MNTVKISHPAKKIKAQIHLPASKSESNRLLILNALAGNTIAIKNLSASNDTQNLVKILSGDNETVDVKDAGTSMRFLTAYYCALGQHKILGGAARLNERPLAPLVNSLSEMGFDIRYTGEEGFPPVEIFPVSLSRTENETYIQGDVSSQFITALMLVAPFLPKGLHIHFTSPPVSRPYIEMTMGILKAFGCDCRWEENAIVIPPHHVKGGDYMISSDWSSASYWYSIAFLAQSAEIYLEGLKDNWIQGDRAIADWMSYFGITTEFDSKGALLRKTPVEYPRMMKLNFRDTPDVAQTFAVMFAAAGVYGAFSGIDGLKIKETDRIAALHNELKKMNIQFAWSQAFEFYGLAGRFHLPETPVCTYGDHRMAMSFAPLALLGAIQIEEPLIVEKSYPGFWKDLALAGFGLEFKYD